MPADLGLCSKCHKSPRIYRTHAYCKECKRDYENKRCASLRVNAPPTPSTTASDMSDSEPTLPPADTGSTPQDTLYVLRYEFDPCGTMGLKIGRAACVDARVRQLEASHNFRLIVLATFPRLGRLEARVHAMLSESRAREGRGREWFHAPLDTVLHTIALAARE